jgi:peptide/nickel transport system permease protein
MRPVTTADAHIDNPRVLAGLSPRAREFRRFARVFLGRPVVAFGLVVIVVFLVVALFAPWIAPYDPNVVDVGNSLQAPSAAHPLGTDALGRDTLSRVVYGTRVSLVIGVGVVFFASIVGGLLGLAAGFMGGWIRAFIMRCTDALMAFPMILLALILIALTGGGLWNLMLALTISMLPVYIRLMCAQVLSLKESDYVTAARAAGSRRSRIMFRRILPNSFPPYIVLMTMMIGGAVLAEAGLSYLGLGISPPTATWGNMVSDGQQYLTSSPLLAFAPGLALMLAVFAFNMVGDGLRDALDPRLRGTL